MDTRKVPFCTLGMMLSEWRIDEEEGVREHLGGRRHHREAPRIMISEGRCEQPYAASLLNISAMSFGALSKQAERVHQLHEHTIEALLELPGAAGIYHPDDLRPHDVYRRVSPTKIQTYAQIFRYVDSGEFLVDVPEGWRHWMSLASPDHFVSKRRREHMQQRRAEQAEQTAPHADGDSTSSPIPRPAPDPTSADRPTA